ncbi:aldehyde dehydrogenase family protein [Actinoplanes sp. L3-i22]|uniref:aldehyde dehydrogenase family protein n=1 Tax=Actinoplanes sp. L3-i22 TaxID=2836373 RepID=UPI001C74B9D6|nr:aldehyde dehydrogenase family protein [Actinoplanes sp. L3-i22]BCY08887.1 aldehyde dehydrogenase [Actinoplanes sp. L3-i22]
MYTDFDLMPLAGKWRHGSSTTVLNDTDPYRGDLLLEIPQATVEDVDAAYTAAREAQPGWASTPASERSAIFLRAAEIIDARQEELVDWLTREAGTTRVRALVEIGIVRATTMAAVTHTSLGRETVASDVPGKENRVYRRPVGVVAVISPWNFPMHLSYRTVAPALAVGNTVVLKPAEDTPVTGGLLIAKILEEAGLPAGVLSVLVGPGSEIGDAIIEHPIPRVISFTGSTGVGQGITRKAGVKRLALELGGNGPFVVLDDADLDRAVEAAVFSSYWHQGQICMATNRVIVDAGIHDEFVERFVAAAGALVTGDPRQATTQIGPIINHKQLLSVRNKVARSVAAGARLLLSGEPHGPTGRVLPPHVLLGTNDVATAAEEVFGPVATIIKADGEQDALRIANDTTYGLSSAVFTEDVERGIAFALRVEAGMTHVNDTTVHDDVHVAFGGEKQSGLGRFGGDWVLDDLTTQHWISVQHVRRNLPY